MNKFKPHSRTALLASLAVCLVLSGGASLAQDRPARTQIADLSTAELIKQRRDQMKDLGVHMRAVIDFIKGVKDNPDEVRVHASKINAIAAELPAMFPAGTGMDDGLAVETGAKSEIWTDWNGFEASAKLFAAETAKLEALSADADRSSLAPQFMVVGKDGCSGCHETFRHKLPGTD